MHSLSIMPSIRLQAIEPTQYGTVLKRGGKSEKYYLDRQTDSQSEKLAKSIPLACGLLFETWLHPLRLSDLNHDHVAILAEQSEIAQ